MKQSTDTFYRWQGQDLILQVKVNPKSATDQITPLGDRLKIKITAPPVDGKANQYLIQYLAKVFVVTRSKIQIERGAHQSLKTIRITQPGSLPNFITPSPI